MGKRKRNQNIGKILLISLVLLILFTGLSKAYDHFKFKGFLDENYQSQREAFEDNKFAGLTESKIETSKTEIIHAHYPKFALQESSKLIEAKIDGYIESFKEDSKQAEINSYEDIPSLYIDYRSFPYKENIASVILDVEENFHNGTSKKSSDIVVIDLKNKEFLELDEILIEEAYDFIARMTKAQFLADNNLNPLLDDPALKKLAQEETYKNFIVKEDSIEFIFPAGTVFPSDYGTASSRISMEEMEDFTKFDLVEAQPFPEEIIQAKIEAANFKGAIRPGLDPNKPMVALTYDDGPYGPTTGPIIDVLEQYDSAATFFVLGQKVESESELLKRAADNGNEIANHSLSHKLLTAISDQELFNEIDTTQNLIETATGSPSTLLRPTYGEHNANMKEKLDLPFILWSIDTMDWSSRNANSVVNTVLPYVRDGDIVLMHDIYPSTAQASQILVPELINRGFQLVTISELFALKEIELIPGETYTDAVGR